jgi:acyl-CoA reductase-like NAD-dependent aldehyde dehydrogenase
MQVSSDDEALTLMNDSPYGLTASVWTSASSENSEAAFLALADRLHTGTVFLNRCDFLDPALAWTGVKDSGRGVSLSKFGARNGSDEWKPGADGMRRVRPAHTPEIGAHENQDVVNTMRPKLRGTQGMYDCMMYHLQPTHLA